MVVVVVVVVVVLVVAVSLAYSVSLDCVIDSSLLPLQLVEVEDDHRLLVHESPALA